MKPTTATVRAWTAGIASLRPPSVEVAAVVAAAARAVVVARAAAAAKAAALGCDVAAWEAAWVEEEEVA